MALPRKNNLPFLMLATTDAPSKSLLDFAIIVASPQNISFCGIVAGRISITPPIASEPKYKDIGPLWSLTPSTSN